MTEQPDWDDTRLDAAFRAAFRHAAPATLMDRVAEEVGKRARRPIWPRRPFFAPSVLAGVALVAVLALTASLTGVSPRPTPGASSVAAATNGATASQPSPEATLTTRVTWPFPGRVTVGGETYGTMTVGDAENVRAAGGGPVSIAVAGWESFATEDRFCTLALTGLLGRLENRCVYNFWLGDTLQPTSPWYDPPIQPAIRFVWATDWQPDPAGIRFRGGSRPNGSGLAVVLVGHFDDPVAAQCRPDVIDQCRSTLVVDKIAWTLTAATFTVPPAMTSGAANAPMSVEEAIGFRDETASSAELAVGGWFEENPVPCPQVVDAQQPLEDCIWNFTWLMRDPEPLSVTASDGSGSIRRPSGPAISLVVDGVSGPTIGQLAYVLAVGHFRDPRSATCPAGDRRTACEQRFVVDYLFGFPAPAASP